jgi:hypothetical protein
MRVYATSRHTPRTTMKILTRPMWRSVAAMRRVRSDTLQQRSPMHTTLAICVSPFVPSLGEGE